MSSLHKKNKDVIDDILNGGYIWSKNILSFVIKQCNSIPFCCKNNSTILADDIKILFWIICSICIKWMEYEEYKKEREIKILSSN